MTFGGKQQHVFKFTFNIFQIELCKVKECCSRSDSQHIYVTTGLFGIVRFFFLLCLDTFYSSALYPFITVTVDVYYI